MAKMSDSSDAESIKSLKRVTSSMNMYSYPRSLRDLRSELKSDIVSEVRAFIYTDLERCSTFMLSIA